MLVVRQRRRLFLSTAGIVRIPDVFDSEVNNGQLNPDVIFQLVKLCNGEELHMRQGCLMPSFR
jgi:hypothetical protein